MDYAKLFDKVRDNGLLNLLGKLDIFGKVCYNYPEFILGLNSLHTDKKNKTKKQLSSYTNIERDVSDEYLLHRIIPPRDL